MRRRDWHRLQERVGLAVFILVALAVMAYVALLIYDFFTSYQPSTR